MLHTKFHGNRSTGSGERSFLNILLTIYGHSVHLGHVTSIMLINFHLHVHVPKSLHTKFGQNGPVVSEKSKF